jgi:hypothetical protein
MEIEMPKPEKKEEPTAPTSSRPPKQPFIVSTPLRTFTLRYCFNAHEIDLKGKT